MPRKYDYDLITKTYEELKDISEVARVLNVPPPSVRGVIMRKPGTCGRCSASIKPTEYTCTKCKRSNADRVKAGRKERRRLGLCEDCDKPYDPPSRSRCTEHRLARQKYLENLRKEKEKTTPKIHGGKRCGGGEGIRNVEWKLYGIEKRYGENGIKCYKEADGRCKICNRQQGEIVIHIHHINCVETDHSYANLICLCYDHHIATHAALRGPSLDRFLNWMTTYANNSPPT